MKKNLGWVFILILLLILAGFVWFSISLTKQKTPSKKEEEAATLNYKKLEKLEGLKHPGQSVSIDEPGFGREDPFVPF